MLTKSIFSCSGVLVIATAQLHSTRFELRFYAGSNPARGKSQVCQSW